MAKKEKKEEKKKEETFNIKDALLTVNPFLREGLERYLFDNGIIVKSQKEFEELLNRYGGF